MLSTNEWDFWNPTRSSYTVRQSQNSSYSIAPNRHCSYDVCTWLKIVLSVLKQSHLVIHIRNFSLHRMSAVYRMTIALYRMTISHDRMTVPLNCMGIVFKVSGAWEWENTVVIGSNAALCEAHTALIQLYEIQWEAHTGPTWTLITWPKSGLFPRRNLAGCHHWKGRRRLGGSGGKITPRPREKQREKIAVLLFNRVSIQQNVLHRMGIAHNRMTTIWNSHWTVMKPYTDRTQPYEFRI